MKIFGNRNLTGVVGNGHDPEPIQSN